MLNIIFLHSRSAQATERSVTISERTSPSH